MKTKPDDSAFNGTNAMTQTGKDIGLTKREEFAKAAMQGLLANYVEYGLSGNHVTQPNVADVAVECADALIEALNKKD